MDWDDLKPKPAKAIAVGENLEALSLAELEARVVSLTAEIERTRTEIARKQKHTAAADALFGKSS